MKKRENRKALMAVLVVCVVALYLCYASGLLGKARRLLSSWAGNPTRLEITQEAKWGGEQPNADGSWSSDKYYMLSAELPSGLSGTNLEVFIEYPEMTSVADTNEITITVATDGGELYEGKYQILASEEMRLVYGSANPQVAIGGDFSRRSDALEVFFYTIPVDQYIHYNEYLRSRFGEAIGGYNYTKMSTHTGVEGETRVTFCRL